MNIQNILKAILISTLSLFFTININSQDIPEHNINIEYIAAELNTKNIDFLDIQPLGNTGFYTIFRNNDETIFTDKDFSVLIQGSAIGVYGNVVDTAILDYNKLEFNFSIMQVLKNINTINYEAKDTKETVYALMDYTCPFCQQFHNNQRKYLLNNNITVKYIPFPRTINEEQIKQQLKPYCYQNNEERKNNYESLIQNNRLNLNIECSKNQLIYFNQIIKLGRIINSKMITPVFITNDGRVIEGVKETETLIELIRLGR